MKLKNIILTFICILLTLNIVYAVECKDSDGGKEFYQYGELFKDGSLIARDTCSQIDKMCTTAQCSEENYGKGNYLIEWFFDENCEQKHEVTLCTAGCKEGACIKEKPTLIYECSDTDGGNNIYEAGIIEGLHYGEPKSFFDYCFTSEILNEFWCDGSKIAGEQIKCPSGYICRNKESGKYGACVKKPIEEPTVAEEEPIKPTVEYAKEKVTCFFITTKEEQKCYSSDQRYSCSGLESCSMEVKGEKGEKLTWKSSCGGYDYNIIDGQDNTIDFNCLPSAEVAIAEIIGRGFAIAYWECYDGARDKELSGCESAESWKRKANSFCKGHCNEDGKCGVKDFSISKECYLEKIGIPPEIVEEAEAVRPETAEEIEPTEEILICKDSCPLDGKCYPFGYRKEERYCSDEGEFVPQITGACENSFECKSNLCIDNNCVEPGLFGRILDWFGRLFS